MRLTKPLLMNRIWPIMMEQAFRLEEDLYGWKRRIPFLKNRRKKKFNRIIEAFGIACNDIVFDDIFSDHTHCKNIDLSSAMIDSGE